LSLCERTLKPSVVRADKKASKRLLGLLLYWSFKFSCAIVFWERSTHQWNLWDYDGFHGDLGPEKKKGQAPLSKCLEEFISPWAIKVFSTCTGLEYLPIDVTCLFLYWSLNSQLHAC
jgi:hypothetical protein